MKIQALTSCKRCGRFIGKNQHTCSIPWNKGKKIEGWGSWNVGRKMSEESKKKMILAQKGRRYSPSTEFKKGACKSRNWLLSLPRGADHPKWKGGISRGYKTGYYSSEYRRWRKAVFKRDSYTCQDCGIQGGYLTAHHIKSQAYYPKLRYKLSNGMTLCEDCHSQTDNYKGRAMRRTPA